MWTNNARKAGFMHIPAAIWMDSSNLIYQQGCDGETHIQINEIIKPERILAITYKEIKLKHKSL